MIPLSTPCIRGNEWKYIKECLDTQWVSSAGKYVDMFEQRIAQYTGSHHAIACVNGTAALQVSLRVAGVQPGDEVLVPTLTFISTINVVSYLHARPLFMDCDEYYTIDVEKTLEFIFRETEIKRGSSSGRAHQWKTVNKRTGARVAAIIPVHVFGNAANLENLVTTCKDRHIATIEDAAESLGTVYSQGLFNGKHTGVIGDIGCLSFNGNKIITTGGGGMIITDNAEYAQKARYLTTQAKDDEIRYTHHDIGYNFRLTNIQAALGVAQLEMLPEYLRIKSANYLHYKERIDAIPGLQIAATPDYAQNNHWMYALQIDNNAYGKDREELMVFLTQHGIQTRPVWYLNHLQQPYTQCQRYKIEKAFEMWEKTLNIPCSVGLTLDDIHTIIDCLEK